MIDLERSRRPERFLSDLIRKSLEGPSRTFVRAKVLAYDVEGGKLQNPDGAGTVSAKSPSGTVSYPALVGPSNPPGSIKARILTNGEDSLIDDDAARVFWPVVAPETLAIPLLPGEHVVVVMEDQASDHGLWISRVPVGDDQNYGAGDSSYTAPRGQTTAMDSFVEPELGYQPDDSADAPPADLTSLFEG